MALPVAPNDPCRTVVDLLPGPEVDHLAFALLRRHIGASLRGDVDKKTTTSRLRRINRLWEDDMVGALRHEVELGAPRSEEEPPAI
jgi:hypothetical protein